MTRKIHIAGFPVRVGDRKRQRCAWCGELILDYDLANIAVCGSDQAEPRHFAPNALVAIEGENPRMTNVVQHEDGAPLPAGWCGDERPAIRLAGR